MEDFVGQCDRLAMTEEKDEIIGVSKVVVAKGWNEVQHGILGHLLVHGPPNKTHSMIL